MILGHIGISGVAKQSLFKRPSFWLLLGASLGPDILDKPGKFILHLPGRSLGHTLIAFLLAMLLMSGFRSRLRLAWSDVFAFGALWLTHLLADWIDPVIFFWPLLGPIAETPYVSFWDTIHNFYFGLVSPLTLFFDLAFCLIALYLWFKPKGLKISQAMESKSRL